MSKCDHNYIRDEEFVKHFFCQKCGHVLDEVSYHKYTEDRSKKRNQMYCFVLVDDDEKIQLKSYETKDDANFARLNATAQKRKTSNLLILSKKILKELDSEILQILNASQHLGYAIRFHANFITGNEKLAYETLGFTVKDVKNEILGKYPKPKEIEIVEIED